MAKTKKNKVRIIVLVSPLSTDNGDVLVASCSQDCYIRVWRISRRHLEAGDASTERSVDKLLQGEEIKLKETIFSFTAKGIALYVPRCHYQRRMLCFASL